MLLSPRTARILTMSSRQVSREEGKSKNMIDSVNRRRESRRRIWDEQVEPGALSDQGISLADYLGCQ